jgi:uncharacterized protein YdeI (YjbR/CyaY-like superfamily)
MPTKPKFFATPAEWRTWLEEQHANSDELWVGFYTRDSRKPSITWPDAGDGALCFGWIDGLRKTSIPSATHRQKKSRHVASAIC